MPGVVRRDSSCKISHGVEFAIAVPSSYVSVVSTLVDRTRLVSSLARACGIFRVDEIVIIDDSLNDSELVKKENNDVGGASSSSTSELMHRLLTYLDTPQYLRRRLIPHHADLAYAGKMPTLDAPLPEAEEGQGLAPRTAGMLHLSAQAWRALLEETQLMLRSGEGMHAPGVWAAANFFDDVRGARRGTIPGYYDGKDPLTLTPFT